MRYFVGVDGGGTKTAFAVAGPDGKVLASAETMGTSYKQYGFETVAGRILDGAERCLSQAGIPWEQVEGCCLGMPCYGESTENDIRLQSVLETTLPAPVYLANDAEVGWAGSLACTPGINLVAGTGSIAFGRDQGGNAARAGGWCEFFGDEGSCYWLGRRTMELFSKEVDGRVPKGPLYEVVRERLALEDDYAFLEVAERDYAPFREKVASFQLLTEQAARMGDSYAASLYKEAASELVLIVQSVKTQLRFAGQVNVSYSGGLFRAGDLILTPFSNLLAEMGCRICTPRFSPLQGAVLLAIEKWKGSER